MTAAQDGNDRLSEIADTLQKDVSGLSKLAIDLLISEWISLKASQQLPNPESPHAAARAVREAITGAAATLWVGTDEVTESYAWRSRKIASLSEEAKTVARETGTDNNRASLLEAADFPAKDQADTLREIVKHNAAARKRAETRAEIAAFAAEQMSRNEWIEGQRLARWISEVAIGSTFKGKTAAASDFLRHRLPYLPLARIVHEELTTHPRDHGANTYSEVDVRPDTDEIFAFLKGLSFSLSREQLGQGLDLLHVFIPHDVARELLLANGFRLPPWIKPDPDDNREPRAEYSIRSTTAPPPPTALSGAGARAPTPAPEDAASPREAQPATPQAPPAATEPTLRIYKTLPIDEIPYPRGKAAAKAFNRRWPDGVALPIVEIVRVLSAEMKENPIEVVAADGKRLTLRCTTDDAVRYAVGRKSAKVRSKKKGRLEKSAAK
jgi:hypothetical protein